MPKIAVVIRQCPGCIPVASQPIVSNKLDSIEAERELREQAEIKIEAFKNQFIEFQKADFYIQFFDL